MSHSSNDRFLEEMQERYEEASDDEERAEVIAELREEGFDALALVLERRMN